MKKLSLLLLPLFALWVLAGCNNDGVDIVDPEPVSDIVIDIQNQTAAPPANVSVFFKVDTKEGAPLANLSEEDFTIYEKGRNDESFRLISADEANRKISDYGQVFAYGTILLLDLSGSVSNNYLDDLKTAAKSFVGEVFPNTSQKNTGTTLGIWWFDGEDKLNPLIQMTDDRDALLTAIDGINASLSQDNSTDLYGAVRKGSALASDVLRANRQRGITSATSVVIFTDGTDQAARYTRESAISAVNGSDPSISYYTIGLGSEIDPEVLEEIGKNGQAFANNTDDLVERFREIAGRVRDEANSFYLFEYCSPKRDGSGSSELKIEVNFDGKTGFETTTFEATGFRGGCSL